MKKLKSYELLILEPYLNNIYLEQSILIYKEKENEKLTHIILKMITNLSKQALFDDIINYISLKSTQPNQLPCHCFFDDKSSDMYKYYMENCGLTKDETEYLITYFPPPSARCNSCGFRYAAGSGYIWNQACVLYELIKKLKRNEISKEQIIVMMNNYQKLMRKEKNEK